MSKIDFHRVKEWLQDFAFQKVFIEELGWSHPSRGLRKATFTAAGTSLTRLPLAELGGFVVFQVEAPDGSIPEHKVRTAAHHVIEGFHHEHVLVFVDKARQKSVWSWVHRREGRDHLRTHYYFKGQPGDLFIGKLGSMMFDIGDFDGEGNVSVIEVVKRVRTALDIEQVTKRFFDDFQKQHVAFLGLVEGIKDERQRRWYVSVLLNRLMFIYFLQRKGFLDRRNDKYLQERLAWTKANIGPNRYFKDFLELLFFDGFAKPPERRSPEARARLGQIKYLNGGLFLPHRVEKDNPEIHVPDVAFENLYALFERYTWHLDDTPGGDDSVINPDVLGYIFEKYINQKSFGAYYTRPEITEWLCEQTIFRALLDRVNWPDELAFLQTGAARVKFEDLNELLMKLDPALCRDLLGRVLPKLTVLDPACGSGAFLVAALKTLLAVYSAVVGVVKTSNDASLKAIVQQWEKEHRNLGYYLKKKIITENLHGVDIMEEATEIARLRLFLTLVASATHEDELEPLPNVDFNIMPGNSLIGLLRVDEAAYDQKRQQELFPEPTYRQLVDEKNRWVEQYRQEHGDLLGPLRDKIEQRKDKARERLNDLLRDDFVNKLDIKVEEPTWDDKKNDVGRSKKRTLGVKDVAKLQPFHWDYEFDDIMRSRGGFDVILANPPWDIFKPNSKEFFLEHSDIITRNNMRIEEFEKEQKKLLKKPEIRKAWLEYLARFPHVSAFYRSAEQYKNQISMVGGKKAGTDINLYKLFVEQSLNLLRTGGQLGIVVPGGLYSDLGTKRLREALFDENQLHALFGLSNEKFLFQGVHHAFRFCLLVATKGNRTERFNAAFRINPREAVKVVELSEFLRDHRQHLELTPDFVRKTSPDSLSVMELKNPTDVAVVEKMLLYPMLGAELADAWKVELANEFHMTNDSDLFKASSGDDRLPLFEGKVIHQYDHCMAAPRYWVSELDGRSRLTSSRIRRLKAVIQDAEAKIDAEELSPSLDYEHYRFGFRDVSHSANERSMICTVLPRKVFAGNTLNLSRPIRDEINDGKWREVPTLAHEVMLYIVAVFNSFVADWFLRQRISAHLNMFYVYQLPVPRLAASDPRLLPIASRAAKLVCTTPEFDTLAKDVGLGSHKKGVTDPEKRAALRAEIDGLVAHLYGLTEEEFAHILQTFPVVPEPVKEAARNAWRAVARGDVQ